MSKEISETSELPVIREGRVYVVVRLMVEAAGVELHKSFCFCNLRILQDRKNLKIDHSQGHRTVIVQ